MVTRVTMGGAQVGGPPPDEPDEAGAEPGDLGGADFGDLLRDAQAVDRGEKPGGPPPDPAAAASAALEAAQGEARELAHAAGALVLPFVAHKWGNDMAACWGPQQLDKIGDAFGMVAQKRGWSLDSMMAGWGPELMLLGAVIGPALPVLMKRANAARAMATPASTAAAPPPDKAGPPPAPPAPPGALPGAADGRF